MMVLLHPPQEIPMANNQGDRSSNQSQNRDDKSQQNQQGNRSGSQQSGSGSNQSGSQQQGENLRERDDKAKDQSGTNSWSGKK